MVMLGGKKYVLARRDTMTRQAADRYAASIRAGGLLNARVIPSSRDPGYYEVYIRSKARG